MAFDADAVTAMYEVTPVTTFAGSLDRSEGFRLGECAGMFPEGQSLV